MKLFHIKTIRWHGKEQTLMGDKHEEFVVADNIQQVIDYCKLDLLDENAEVEGIAAAVPITKILCKL